MGRCMAPAHTRLAIGQHNYSRRRAADLHLIWAMPTTSRICTTAASLKFCDACSTEEGRLKGSYSILCDAHGTLDVPMCLHRHVHNVHTHKHNIRYKICTMCSVTEASCHLHIYRCSVNRYQPPHTACMQSICINPMKM